ncbi:unnamed protein product [Hyaloperonospora brassicae]|uniref:Uncharacterized protein n=1 Tax=Hyaloperonospora brassicae TaxID=162125 RepID=A0AAV0UAC1_HYABA|nr:unnamed protein product [Hyaloperonospora brassicae]
MRGFRIKYDRWLQHSPLLTKGVTSAILFGVGDRLAQQMEDAKPSEGESHDAETDDDSFGLKRTARMMVWGGLFFAPFNHAWYNLLEKVVRGNTATAIVKKIAADQLIVTPPVTLSFFTYAGLSDGKSLHDTMEHASAKLRPTLAANWAVWPLVHVGTFGFVPLHYRVLFINVVNIGWSAFLSRMAS